MLHTCHCCRPDPSSLVQVSMNLAPQSADTERYRLLQAALPQFRATVYLSTHGRASELTQGGLHPQAECAACSPACYKPFYAVMHQSNSDSMLEEGPVACHAV